MQNWQPRIIVLICRIYIVNLHLSVHTNEALSVTGCSCFLDGRTRARVTLKVEATGAESQPILVAALHSSLRQEKQRPKTSLMS